MIQGKNSLSYKKKNVKEQNTPHTGFKNITFAHEFAAAGETFIPFSSLITPTRWLESGLVNPAPSSLLNAQLQAFRPNITVTSSVKGLIQKEEYIVYNNRIEFKDFVSEVNEVFEVEVSDVMITGNLIVDMKTIRIEGELADAQVQFNMGYEFDVNNEEIIVFRDGIQMFRSDNNDNSGATGNYYYLDTGNGKATVIEFFEAAVGEEPILIASTGGRVDSPNVSTFQEIEKLAGQIDAVIPTVAALAGVPETDFQSSPNQIDLKAFGDQVLNNENRIEQLENYSPDNLSIIRYNTPSNRTQIIGGDTTCPFNDFTEAKSYVTNDSGGFFSLQSGEYIIKWNITAFSGFSDKVAVCSLFNVSDAIVSQYGSYWGGSNDAAAYGTFHGIKRLTLTATKQFRIRAGILQGSTGSIFFGDSYANPHVEKGYIEIEKIK